MTKKQGVTLALYPNMRGFGFALLDNPISVLDFGVISARPLTNAKLFRRMIVLIEFYKPEIVLVRDYNTRYSRRCKRIELLLRQIIAYAEENKLPLYQYSREQIKDVFEIFKAKTKYEIAKKIISAMPTLKLRLPKPSRVWEGEAYNMGIFDAISLAITHAYLTE